MWGNNSCIWIIILILLFSCCGCGNNTCGASNDCGCGNGCGCNNNSCGC